MSTLSNCAVEWYMSTHTRPWSFCARGLYTALAQETRQKRPVPYVDYMYHLTSSHSAKLSCEHLIHRLMTYLSPSHMDTDANHCFPIAQSVNAIRSACHFRIVHCLLHAALSLLWSKMCVSKYHKIHSMTALSWYDHSVCLRCSWLKSACTHSLAGLLPTVYVTSCLMFS